MRPLLKITLIILHVILLPAGIIFAQQNSATETIKRLMQNFQYDDAIKEATGAIGKDSANYELYILKGQSQAALSRYSEALKCFKKALLLDTVNIKILAVIADLYKLTGDAHNTVATYKKITELQPGNSYFKTQLGMAYFADENFQGAKNIFCELVNEDSLNPYLLKQLAASYSELKNADSAKYFYKRVILINPKDVAAISKLANIYNTAEEYQKGIELTEDYRKLDSVNKDINKLSGYFYYLTKDYLTAKNRFLLCLQYGGNSRFVNKYLGLSLYRQEEFYNAGKYFKAAYLADSTDAELCFYLGVCCARSYAPDSGLYFLEKTLSLILPENQFLAKIYSEISNLYNQFGQPQKSLDYLTKSFELSRENKILIFKLAYQYDYFLDNRKTALKYYKDYLNSNSDTSLEAYYINYAKKRVRDIPQNISVYQKVNTPRVKAFSFKIKSAILNEERTVWVSLPPDFVNSRIKYPALFCFDGSEDGAKQIQTINDSLCKKNKSVEMIVVGIQNTDRKRDITPVKTSTCPNPGADKFLQFISSELIPVIENKYRALPQRSLYGQESGAVLALYALVTRPELFSNYFALDVKFGECKDFMLQTAQTAMNEKIFDGKFLFMTCVSHGNPVIDQKTAEPAGDFFSIVDTANPIGLKRELKRYEMPVTDSNSNLVEALTRSFNAGK